MERIKLQLHLGDYFRDTIHLSTTGHGAYFLLICHYYTHGKLPDNEDEIRQVTKLRPDQWPKYKTVLQSFFRDGWKHKRIDAEIALAKAVSEARRTAGQKGGSGPKAMSTVHGLGQDHAIAPNPLKKNDRPEQLPSIPSSFFQDKYMQNMGQEAKGKQNTPTNRYKIATGFYASFASPELDAWSAYEAKTRKSFPRDKAGGWTFPSQWPPETA